jgi:hypothetical protein
MHRLASNQTATPIAWPKHMRLAHCPRARPTRRLATYCLLYLLLLSLSESDDDESEPSSLLDSPEDTPLPGTARYAMALVFRLVTP